MTSLTVSTTLTSLASSAVWEKFSKEELWLTLKETASRLKESKLLLVRTTEALTSCSQREEGLNSLSEKLKSEIIMLAAGLNKLKAKQLLIYGSLSGTGDLAAGAQLFPFGWDVGMGAGGGFNLTTGLFFWQAAIGFRP